MGKFKWILVAGALLALCSGQMMAGPGSDTRVFFDEHMTTNASAVLMQFGASLSDGTRTAIAVSNTTASPAIEDLPGECPDGEEVCVQPLAGDMVGGVWLVCYNTLTVTVEPALRADMHEGGVEPIVAYSGAFTDPEMVGTGLDENGGLAAGKTWLVFLDEVFAASSGEVEPPVEPTPLPALRADSHGGDFVGYCWVIGEFDAISGLSISSAGGAAFGVSMTSDFAGVPLSVAPAPAQ